MKILIVGGVAGGASAAARIRRLNEEANIVIFERSEYISYANCGLPYYIGGKITKKQDLTLNSPENFKNRFNIDVRVKAEVIAVDTANKKVSVKNLETGEVYKESYDKLLLSPGAKAIKPNLEGVDREEIFTLRTVKDTLEIKEYIDKNKPQTAVIVGGGYIGLEMAENLAEAGIKTTIIEKQEQLMAPLDEEMALFLQGYVKTKGINLVLGTGVLGFEDDDGQLIAKTDNGRKLAADLVMLAIGVMPDTGFIKDSGINLGNKGAIIVDEHMQTSIKDVYAVGDAVEITNFVTGKKGLIPLAGPANRQGRIVADNICGIDSKFNGTQGSSVIKVFDLTVATTGINEKTAIAEGLNCDKAIIGPTSHATYYPDATNIVIKVVFEKPTGKILGAQLIGRDGADKACDVFATAIRAGMTAYDLTDLELCYAPPYSSAKSPANMAGFVIENLLTGKLKQMQYNEVDSLDSSKYFILDARKEEEYESGHINGAINIPLDLIRSRVDEIDKTKIICIYCKTALRSYIACRMLSQMGFYCINVAGGYYFYSGVKDGIFDMTPTYGCGINIK